MVIDGTQVRAFDPSGKDAWTATWDAVSPEDRGTDDRGLPLLRQVSPTVVAVVDGGRTSGEGLDKDTYDAKVTLLSISDGSVVKKVTLPGTDSTMPEPGKIGLGFFTEDSPESASAVMPTGAVEEATSSSGKKVVGAATVGDTAVALTGDDSEYPDGFSGPGYTSATVAPNSTYTQASIQASNADHWLLARFAVVNGDVKFRLIAADSGKVLSKPNCDPSTASQIVMSPQRTWGVLGPMRLDSQGRAVCFGGKKQRQVTFTAVTDEGRAFGTATDGPDDPVFVDVAGGSVTTSEMPRGATPPIGVMNGNLAIHWDTKSGVLTANPIK